MPVRTILSAFFALLSCACPLAQTCPTGIQSDKLICLLPQVYGADGLAAAVKFGDFGQFTANFLVDKLAPIESSIARQSALLPLASPSSGLTYTWDPASRVFVSSTESFGPILGERAKTMGRHKLFVGLSYQYFNFDRIDGVNLKSLPVTLDQADDSTTFAGNPICSARSNTDAVRPDGSVLVTSFGQCGYIRDLIETTNRIDLKIHQVTTYVTFGLTNKIDISAAIPVENVRMSVSSAANIIYKDNQSGEHFYGFDPTRKDCQNVPLPCLSSTFANNTYAEGIGDVTIRVKGTGWKGERAAVGWGVDLRLPTGDQMDFLGIGAVGVRPFAVWSYSARVSPHALFGYQANGSSIIGGDLNTGQKGRIPESLTYLGGADVWLTKRITAGFDLVGQEVPRAQIVSPNPPFVDLGECNPDPGADCSSTATPRLVTQPQPHANLNVYTGSYNAMDGSAGVKIRAGTNLLIIGNALFKLNDQGLRAKPIPLIGASYTF